MPPSFTASGGSSTMARPINSTRSGDSESWAVRLVSRLVGRASPRASGSACTNDSAREVAGVAAAGAEAAQGAFEIADVRELGAEGIEALGVFDERRDGFLPQANRF